VLEWGAHEISRDDECSHRKLSGHEGAVHSTVHEVYEAEDVQVEVFDVDRVDDSVGGSVCQGWERVGCEGMSYMQSVRDQQQILNPILGKDAPQRSGNCSRVVDLRN